MTSVTNDPSFAKNACRCGHVRNAHIAYSKTEWNGCRFCGCAGFVHDERGAWLPLVRAAELVLRGDAELRVVKHLMRSEGDSYINVLCNPNEAGWYFTIATDSDLDLNDKLDPDERAQLADLTAARWLDESNNVDTRLAVEHLACPTCGVDVDQPCNPVHSGERGPGGWAHPARGVAEEHRQPMTRVQSWALRVANLSQPNDVDAPVAVDIAREIVQLTNARRELAARLAEAPKLFERDEFTGDALTRRMIAWAYSRRPDDEKTLPPDVTPFLVACCIRRLDTIARGSSRSNREVRSLEQNDKRNPPNMADEPKPKRSNHLADSTEYARQYSQQPMPAKSGRSGPAKPPPINLSGKSKR